MRKILLASSSPRRRELVAKLALPYEVVSKPVEESSLEGESPQEMVKRLALAKARAVCDFNSSHVILAADTIVFLEGNILGKPQDEKHAREMLLALKGRSHLVFTGVAVLVPPSLELVGVECTLVLMRDYSLEEIEAYVGSGRALDKAGAYGVQEEDFRPVAEVRGCYTNVMGLPLCLTAELLGKAGFRFKESPLQICESATPEEFRGSHALRLSPGC
ncbi:MAG: Maf family protein [Anaerolineae bacterium]|nr:Maf family protein [Anaerolineae bacterium]MDW8102522.1 Maf family protein [Anaerolineae bacterium]